MTIGGVLVASITSWTLDISTDRVDVTAFGDTNKQYVQGLPDYSGSFEGWWDTSDLSLLETALAGTQVTLRLVPSSDDATQYFEGSAFLDASVATSATGAVSVSGTFAAAGTWSLFGA